MPIQEGRRMPVARRRKRATRNQLVEVAAMFFERPIGHSLACGAAAALFAVISMGASPAGAAWDPGGLPVCTASGVQTGLVAVPDGSSGMIMAWEDHRDGQSKVYAQRVDVNGNLLWTTNGVLVGGHPSTHPGICADGSGGAWVVCSTAPSGYGAIYARHIDAAGTAGSIIVIAGGSVWSHNTLPVCTTDGAGGAIVAWVQEVDPPSGDLQIVAQRVNSVGTKLWGSQGVLVYFDIGAGEKLSIAADDGCHGAFVAWKTPTGAGIVQRLDASGVRRFNDANGYSLGLVTPGSRVRVADRVRASQGAYVMYGWQGGLFDAKHLRVIALDSTAYQFWYNDVASTGTTDDVGNDFRVIDNGLQGVYAVWDRIGSGGAGTGVYATNLHSNGSEIWGGAVRISDAQEGKSPDAVVEWGLWDLLVSWVGLSEGNPRIKYVKVYRASGATGADVLVPGGRSSMRPRIVAAETGAAFPLICWMDERVGGGETDIYAAGLTSGGLPLRPNLIATALRPELPVGVAGGGWHSFRVTVKNYGTCPSDSFWTTIFPNQAMAPSVGDLPGSNVQSARCGPLGVMDSISVEVRVLAPESPMTYSMWGFADYLGEIEEFGQESDNIVGPVLYEWLGYANLVVTNVSMNTTPYPLQFITATVTVKNVGTAAASPVRIDYWANETNAPAEGEAGDQYRSYFNVNAGDSVVWTTNGTSSMTFCRWTSWFRVDAYDLVDESNEDDNLSGPHYVNWRIPPQSGWPVLTGAGFHSSPAIAEMDGDPRTLEVVIGCDNGKLYCLDHAGQPVGGWPVTLGDSIYSSPAVGDITGDSRNEVVVGCDDGRIYAYDCYGTKLWHLDTGGPVRTTPTLADLDDDGKLEVICGSSGYMYALRGNGASFGAGWPVDLSDATPTSTAVGDVDGDGSLEIAFFSRKGIAPASKVHLLKSTGADYSASWPVAADTVFVAGPVLGSIATPATSLEIVAAGINGKVYAWNYAAASWPGTTQLGGRVDAAPALYHHDKDGNLEIVAGYRRQSCFGSPPICSWTSGLAMVEDIGGIGSGWPQTLGFWPAGGNVPSPIILGVSTEIMCGSPSDRLYSYEKGGGAVYGFPLDAGADIVTSAAAGNLDGDGWIELVVAASNGTIRCYKLRSYNYTDASLVWPMLGHDRARTHCYGFEVPTGVDDDAGVVPVASAIRSIFPNPFNPSTRIVFDLASSGRAELAIFDAAGRRVAVLVEGELEAGRYEIMWNGRTLSGGAAVSGVYFCRLEAGAVVENRKLILIR
jgi:hypothetical protein